MNTLYILGNGFDLYHSLDTKYQSFAKYLEKVDCEVYDLILNYYGLPHLTADSSNKEYALWARFEEALADLDYEQVLEDNSGLTASLGDPDFRDRDWHSYQIEMELIIEKLTDNLKSRFTKFILSLNYPINIDHVRINLNSESLFLNFNYTDTLERYYSIERSRICYIHNKVEKPKAANKRTLESNTQIILGHGTDPANYVDKDEVPPEGLSDEELDQWNEQMADQYEYSYDSAKSEILTYYTKSFKNSKDVISDNYGFFSEINNILNVFVLGHSISNVDIEYFKMIKSRIAKKAIWNVAYYSDLEKKNHLQTLTDLGIDAQNINQIRIEDLK